MIASFVSYSEGRQGERWLGLIQLWLQGRVEFQKMPSKRLSRGDAGISNEAPVVHQAGTLHDGSVRNAANLWVVFPELPWT